MKNFTSLFSSSFFHVLKYSFSRNSSDLHALFIPNYPTPVVKCLEKHSVTRLSIYSLANPVVSRVSSKGRHVSPVCAETKRCRKRQQENVLLRRNCLLNLLSCEYKISIESRKFEILKEILLV